MALSIVYNTKLLHVSSERNKGLKLERHDNTLVRLRCDPGPMLWRQTRSPITHPNATMPSLTQDSTHVGDWECVTCCEDYNTVNDSPWQTEDGESLVCGGCIIHLFEQALENDYSWPPRFGPDILHSQDFASLLPREPPDRVTRRVAQAEPRIKPEEVAEATVGCD